MTQKSSGSMNLSLKILIYMVAGAIIGAIFKTIGSAWIDTYLVEGLFHVVGSIFVNSLKMLMVPLVLVSIIVGTSSLADPSKLGRLGLKTIGLYLFTTAVAVTLGMTLAGIFDPGSGITIAEASVNIGERPTMVQWIIDLVPKNVMKTLVDENMLSIIIFAILMGLAITRADSGGERIRNFFNDFNDVIMALVNIIMRLAPYGVFALIAKVFATFPFADLAQGLGTYFILVFVALLLHAAITYSLLIKLGAGLNPVIFFKKMWPAILTAFGTSSSSATIPVTMRMVRKRLGVSSSTASFTIPLGATINMDGTAIMQGVATIFIAQAYGVDLTTGQLLTVVLMATMASVGTAGVPGVGIIMLSGVLTQVGLPAEAIGIIMGIDRLLDMTRTAVNISGDAAVTCIVGKSEGDLDESIFNDPDAEFEGQEQEDKPSPVGTLT